MWISALRQILCKLNVFFGGLNILFCGDFGQLAPVGDRALYNDEGPTAGRLAYRAFNRTIVLKEIMRQKGQSERARLFRRTLNQIRDGPIDKIGYDFLASRSRPNLSQEEWTSFRDAIRLYPLQKTGS